MKAFLFRNLIIKEVTLAQLRQFSDFVRGPVAVAYESLVFLSFKFRIIACSELLFRPNMFENGYAVLADNQDPMDLIVAKDAQEHVDEKWSELDDSDLSRLDA